MDVLLPLVVTAFRESHHAVYFVRPYDLKTGTLIDRVKTVQPTAFLGVPRAAPMSREVQEYFAGIGIAILDVYGASESTGGVTGNSIKAHQFGTVGHTLPGMDVRVFQKAEGGDSAETGLGELREPARAKDIFHPSEEEQGEVCFRGRSVMLGYMANPKLGEEHVAEVERKNASAIDRHGWYHSGDKGACSKKNMFVITGRYKEIIIGAGGENIAPLPMEDAVKSLASGVANAIMIGDKRKFNIMLITLRAEGATGEFPGSDNLDPDVRSIGSDSTRTIQKAMTDSKWIEHVRDAISKTNANGDACQSNAWKIGRFTILPYDISIVGGELTPTLKLKRNFVDEKFKAVIDHVYAHEGDSKDLTYVPCPIDRVPRKISGDESAAGAANPEANVAEPVTAESGSPSEVTTEAKPANETDAAESKDAASPLAAKVDTTVPDVAQPQAAS
ncbi:Long-chain-fatty-acid--CoA ligase ACSBG2 [Hondaea fermentalgiana]|uniref:Long-chain-fatty-acid--CoA ligase ACSBG2 n=1 Tax=Hondaea fermentalgiana TaxID=2315210 RepID=A0A2R5GGN4_9STRA|nr:Long-chain-fatty-acid--CoA ligase ACSBG2 [Hondaea fermentalgiana]|eukprot:GBG30066.1 Long-chain-fatty-acid--CoA ligase ACSBG2 [Hondaea fermentalgiana]